MSKQDQNHSSGSHQDKKQTHATPQGSHKEKAPENLEHESEQGFMQGSKSKENKDKSHTNKSHPTQGIDRNEGEERSQKS